MNMIVCIDDEGGILFNHRRVSKDRLLMQWIAEHVRGNPIWASPYSKELFAGCEPTPKLMLAEDYLKKGAEEKEAYCFVEDDGMKPFLAKTKRILLCKWNRRYPSDVKFPLDSLKNFTLKNTWEFPGSSHEKIRVEEWICK